MGRNMVMRPEFGGGNYLESAMIVALVGWMRAVQRMLPVGIHLALRHVQNISQGNTARSGPKFGEIEDSVSPIMISAWFKGPTTPSEDAFHFATNCIELALMSAVHGQCRSGLDRG